MLTESQGKDQKKVWIDLDNSPHVPFFKPIIQKLADMDCQVEITARDCFQVCGLADLFNLKYRRIGRHYGKWKLLKIIGTLIRTIQLTAIVRKNKPDIALSHGSRAMAIAAAMLNIPEIAMTDYECAQHIPFLKPDMLIVPEVVVAEFKGHGKTRVVGYPGIKEDVYVPFFNPDKEIKNELNLGENQIVVTIRPPATEAHYHNPESEILFAEVLGRLGAIDDVIMIILPRNEIKQTSWIKKNWPDLVADKKIVIPSKVVDGLNLIWHSDLVISGGGTMNREAAALGVPVYSIFRGKIGAVDRYLQAKGRLTLLESREDVGNKINVCRRAREHQKLNDGSPALNSIQARQRAPKTQRWVACSEFHYAHAKRLLMKTGTRKRL
jgi:predicted glycosyltransferase